MIRVDQRKQGIQERRYLRLVRNCPSNEWKGIILGAFCVNI
jgi:hypothetical protein